MLFVELFYNTSVLLDCHDVIIKPEKQVADVGWPYFVSCKIFANSPHFELNDAKFDAKFQVKQIIIKTVQLNGFKYEQKMN